MRFDADKKYEIAWNDQVQDHRVKVTSPDGSFVYLPHRLDPPPGPSVPLVVPVVYKPLSLDAMIGIFCLLFFFALGGYSLNFVLVVGGIGLTVWAWRQLSRVAPVTAQVILLIFLVLLSALLSAAGRGGRRGRWRGW